MMHRLTAANVDYISGLNLLSDQQFEKDIMARALEQKNRYANTVSL